MKRWAVRRALLDAGYVICEEERLVLEAPNVQVYLGIDGECAATIHHDLGEESVGFSSEIPDAAIQAFCLALASTPEGSSDG